MLSDSTNKPDQLNIYLDRHTHLYEKYFAHQNNENLKNHFTQITLYTYVHLSSTMNNNDFF